MRQALHVATSRRIRALALAADTLRRAAPERLEAAGADAVALAVALHALGIGDLGPTRALAEAQALAARIALEAGPGAVQEYALWSAFAAATADREAWRHGADLVTLCADLGAPPECQPLLDAAGPEALLPVLERFFGLDDGLVYGVVPGSALKYPVAYRLAVEWGELRTAHLLAQVGGDARARARVAEVLPVAIERLGLDRYVPADWADARRRLAALDDDAAWTWAGQVFEVAIGAGAGAVFEAAHHRSLAGASEATGLLARRAAAGLAAAVLRLGNPPLARALAEAGDALVDDRPDARAVPEDLLAAPCATFDGWFATLLPRDVDDALSQARVLVAVERFADEGLRLTDAHVERFLRQFPSAVRWVGEQLVDAVEFVSTAHVLDSLAFLLHAYGLARNPSVAVCVADALDPAVARRLHARGLDDALHEPHVETIAILRDACVTGSGFTARLGALLDEDDARLEALKHRSVVLVCSRASLSALDLLGAFFEARGVPFRAVVGAESSFLSRQGWRELDEGTLHDPRGWLTSPETQLAAPLFSPHGVFFQGRDWKVARDLCREIGHALLQDEAVRGGWDDDTRRAHALGMGGIQGRLAFGHRVPRSTLTLLWCAGTWRDQPWVPLFPSADFAAFPFSSSSATSSS